MLFYLLVLLLTLLVIKQTKKLFHFYQRGIPSVVQLPLFGLETLLEDPLKINLQRLKKYGTLYGTYLGNMPIIVIADPEIAKVVTIKEFNNFNDKNLRNFNAKYIQESFTRKKGQAWKDGRAIVSPVFSTKRVKEIYVHFQKASKPFFANIDRMIDAGQQDEIDIKALLRGYSLDCVAKFVYALELNSAREPDHPFVKNVRRLLSSRGTLMNLIETCAPKFLIDFFDFQFVDVEALEYIASLTRAIIKQRTKSGGNYGDFLDLMLDSIREKKLDVKEEEIIGSCLVFIFAGLDTITTTISNALYCLVQHPEYQERLYQEIIEACPDKEMNYETRKETPLLDAVLKESQRQYPIINYLFRKAERPIQIKNLHIKAGDVVAIDIFSLQNSPEHWHDAHLFKPERFMEKQSNNDDSSVFLPFGSGPRTCVALRMAFVQCQYLLAKLIMNYEIYKTEKTSVNYVKIAHQLIYPSLVIGFRKRNN